MQKIGFYINNNGIENIDCSNIHLANPGLGGTPYLFYLLTYYLSKDNENKYDIILLTTKPQIFNNIVKNYIVQDDLAAIDFCKKNRIDLLVVRTTNNIDFYSYSNKKI